MRRLPKLLAAALLLAPVATRAEIWCTGENDHIWTFASGQTIYTFRPDHPIEYSLSRSQAYSYADPLCQLAWNNFASNAPNVDESGYLVNLYSVAAPEPGYQRWRYRCQACVTGHLPYVLLAHPARLGPAEAGGIANGEVAGQVVSVTLHDANGDRPYYLVDVLTKTEQVQVLVDANTGHAEVANPDEVGVCRE